MMSACGTPSVLPQIEERIWGRGMKMGWSLTVFYSEKKIAPIVELRDVSLKILEF
jgi:hypothetical protein